MRHARSSRTQLAGVGEDRTEGQTGNDRLHHSIPALPGVVSHPEDTVLPQLEMEDAFFR